MGEQSVSRSITTHKKAKFIKHLLEDVDALEYMLEHKLIESGISRIGAEQEFCLVTSDWRPAINNEAILKAIDDPHFTTELARYNLEINLDPIELKNDCFSKTAQQLRLLLEKASAVANSHDTKIVLTGILPTITNSHLHPDYITPNPRYYALNEMLKELRRSDFHLHLQGVDELSITHDCILYEACNTSFQLHLQIDPDDFVSSFNWAQAISAPVLGISCNAPLLLGRELWDETRIALFRQSIDTRHISNALKDQEPRVAFGSDWASGSAVDIYKENISKYKIILSRDITESSLETLAQGGIPKLEALNLHSGTIYPWNRACYGVGGGKPHLRIENRYIPSGPSVLDEMANFAFWVGIMMARPKRYDDMPSMMSFKDAKDNFIKSARYGKSAILKWDGQMKPVTTLIKEVFLPLAKQGLQKANIAKEDIEMLLGTIEERCNGNTGAEWMRSNYRKLQQGMKKDKALRLLTKSIHLNQLEGTPVHKWKDADTTDPLKEASSLVGHIMSTRVFTVSENDLATMASSIMKWNDIHHVPVEDENGQLCGVLTWTHIENLSLVTTSEMLLVKDIMEHQVISVDVNTPIKEAIQIMKTHEIGCLPVTQKSELIGIVTIKDMLPYNED